MTYMTTRMRKRYVKPRPRPSGLQGWWDDLTSPLVPPPTSAEAQCIDTANATMAPFDAKIDDLVKNWTPTGFYTTDDVRAIVGKTMAVVQQAQASLDQASKQPNASQDTVMRATDDLARAGGRSIDYLQAAAQADQQRIPTVNAAGLKRWVTDTLAAASSAMVAASVIGCIAPWWVAAVALFQQVFDVAWSFVRAVAGVVVKLGEISLKVPDLLDDLADSLGWILGAGIAGWLFYQAYKRFDK